MTDLPAWYGKDRESRNVRSRRQEARHAANTGGRVQAGSGSSWRAKQDVRSAEHLDQLKFTDSNGYRLTADELKKVFGDALQSGREGRMIIEFSQHNLTIVIQEYNGD